jgi:hypothetical protein
MDDFDVSFCFYDEKGYVRDADSESRILQRMHARLWSKDLPNGDRLEWTPDAKTRTLSTELAGGTTVWVSSDTIATTHSNYAGVRELHAGLDAEERDRIERAFYTIAGFMVFPVHPQSLNQVRGRKWEIRDRFDLTLECIRRHYLAVDDNPLASVLTDDAGFFALFGGGQEGFENYVQFFLLDDLWDGQSIRWFDGFEGSDWDFTTPALPDSASSYLRYLDVVGTFVTSRNARIADWLVTP